MYMNDEQRRRKYSQEEKQGLIREYSELRQLLRNPYVTMKVYVLEPVCERCRYGRAPMEDGDTFLPVSHPIRPPHDNCYMYPAKVDRGFYASAQGIIMRQNNGHEISCVDCEEDLTEETMLFVRERSFQEYFCLIDKSNGLPKWLRKHILECYGCTCFNCGKKLSAKALTIDHIIPQARGGDDRPTNLQPLCNQCNQKKKDAHPETVHVFLDFLTRPMPSDAYSELIW
jgi:5-methylcytosine-specific restriction protein A